MFDSQYFAALGLAEVHSRVLAGERLSPEQGELLFACPDIHALGALAHHARCRLHGNKAYYVRNRHINYSNICVNRCLFCAFRRDAGSEGAFTLGREDIIERALDDGGHPFAEIHVVGGCHPSLSLAWFEDIFRTLKELRPRAVLKAFTVAEIAHLAALEGISALAVLARLKAAGVAMLTGGGAEIFEPAVRQRICPEKISGADYLRIAGEAHSIGLKSNCSMLFGHVESPADRVAHLCALREQQDKSGGFVCFIPLAFQPLHNALAQSLAQDAARRGGRGPEMKGQDDGKLVADIKDGRPDKAVSGAGRGAGNCAGKGPASDVAAGLDRLRTIAVARLLLDNIPHIKAYWVMLGVKCAQTALSFGADDLDGTIMEERIGHMAGADSEQALSRAELEALIVGCGFVPVNRDALFQALDNEGGRS